MAEHSIDQDPNFRYLDKSESDELGYVECYENKVTGDIVAKKTVRLDQTFSSPNEVSILNTILGLQPQELSPVSHNYHHLVQHSTFPQLNSAKKSADLFFLDSPVTLDCVSQYLKEQNKWLDESDIFAIFGFLMAAGLMMEEHLGFHPCIYPSSLLVMKNHRLSLMHPLMYENYIKTMSSDVVDCIARSGKLWEKEWFRNQEKREIYAETHKIQPKSAEESSIATLVDNHRKLVGSTIDGMFQTILAIVSNTEIDKLFKEQNQLNLAQIESSIEKARQHIDPELVDLLQHVLLNQAYESFKTLDEHINTLPTLKQKIVRWLNTSPLTAKSRLPGGQFESTLIKAVNEILNQPAEKNEHSRTVTENSSQLFNSTFDKFFDGHQQPETAEKVMTSYNPEVDFTRTNYHDAPKAENNPTHNSQHPPIQPSTQEKQGWRGVQQQNSPGGFPPVPSNQIPPFYPQAPLPPGFLSPSFPPPGPTHAPFHPQQPFMLPPGLVPPAKWTPPQAPPRQPSSKVFPLQEFNTEVENKSKSEIKQDTPKTGSNPFTGEQEKDREQKVEVEKYPGDLKTANDITKIEELVAYTKKLEQQIENQQKIINHTQVVQRQQQEENDKQRKEIEELKKIVYSQNSNQDIDANSETQSVSQKTNSRYQDPPTYNPNKVPPSRVTNVGPQNSKMNPYQIPEMPKTEPNHQRASQTPTAHIAPQPSGPHPVIRGRRLPPSFSQPSPPMNSGFPVQRINMAYPFRAPHHFPYDLQYSPANLNMNYSPRPIVTEKPPQILTSSMMASVTQSQTFPAPILHDQRYVYDDLGQKVYLQDTSPSTLAKMRHIGARPTGSIGVSRTHFPISTSKPTANLNSSPGRKSSSPVHMPSSARRGLQHHPHQDGPNMYASVDFTALKSMQKTFDGREFSTPKHTGAPTKSSVIDRHRQHRPQN